MTARRAPLTDEQIVRQAVKLIGRLGLRGRVLGEGSCREEVEHEVAWMQFDVTSRRHSLWNESKQAKGANEKMAAALWRVEAAHKSEHLEPIFKNMFPVKTVQKWRRHFEAAAATPSRKAAPSAKIKKQAAARHALNLLDRYNLRDGRSVWATTTRNKSLFCRLAAVLYGDPTADLQHYCRAELRKRKTK